RIDARAPTEPARVSGKVTQVHVHPQDPHIVALEIDHMDYQVHFYDTRTRGFGRKPWLDMSSTSASAPASSAPKLGSRYIRGSTVHSLFARGYADGVVLVWDLRNGAQKRAHFKRPAEVAHTVLAGTDVVAYGGYSATFWSTLGG
ncbi:uncharacterized protein TRAVEDRAFT_115203, partial [Trametes versicolor FP-101664 SS1]|uniref:uncharacterized protein n=1 Tax=Trametes versicolor (strain FP-101664) TaxID=717944 RepID=UPI0004622734